MSRTTLTQKPVLLVFPVTASYNRCLILAKYLRNQFKIYFLHSDVFAQPIYEQGYDTFNLSSFPTLQQFYTSETILTSELEKLFLEQVQAIEQLKPNLIIGDGMPTLAMASEYTGVPYISVINGYHSPYYTQSNTTKHISNHKPYKTIRERYDLVQRQGYIEEYTGDLNWICDLAGIYPQLPLPSNYVIIGPLYDPPSPSLVKGQYSLQDLKKNIYIQSKTSNTATIRCILDKSNLKASYKLVFENKEISLLNNKQAINLLPEANIINADLVICDTYEVYYKALHYGIPVLFYTTDSISEIIGEMLFQNNIGNQFSYNTNIPAFIELIEYWINKKNSEEHRSFTYNLKVSVSTIQYRIDQSIAIHLPFINRHFTMTIY